MKIDYLSSLKMQSYLQVQLVEKGAFKGYTVCDVGFWDLDVSTDSGFSWHNDHNWNAFLRPDNKTLHGWFVNSCTDDCNSTLAVSTNSNYNECNTNTILGITGINNDDGGVYANCGKYAIYRVSNNSSLCDVDS